MSAVLLRWVILVVLGTGCAGSPDRPDHSDRRDGPADSTSSALADVSGSVRVDSPRVDEIAVVYDPTPIEVVDAMLERAGVTSEDVVVDLGSGDGRIPIRAAQKFGARGIGYELDSALVARSRAAARDSSVAGRVTFFRRDMFEADLEEATVVTLYLLPSLNVKLRPRLLRELDPGDRIVSHRFDMGDWAAHEEGIVGGHRFYLWVVSEEEPVL